MKITRVVMRSFFYFDKGSRIRTKDTVIFFISWISDSTIRYSLCPEILDGGMDVSRCILVLDTFIFMHLFDKYLGAEGVFIAHLFPIKTINAFDI